MKYLACLFTAFLFLCPAVHGDPFYNQPALGNRHLLVILAHQPGDPLTCDANSVNEVIWSDYNSVRGEFLRQSYGQLDYVPDTDGNGWPDIVGPIELTATNLTAWRKAALNIVTALGVDVSLYDTVVITYPASLLGGGGIAFADVNCGPAFGTQCIVHSKGCGVFLKATLFHELGHTLGLFHSGKNLENDLTIHEDGYFNFGTEYGDRSCPMGIAAGLYTHLSAPQVHRLGWLDAYPGSILEVESSAQIELAPIASIPTFGVRSLIALTMNSVSDVYYISFRRKWMPRAHGLWIEDTQIDHLDDDHADKVGIHRYAPFTHEPSGAVITRPALVGVLGVGDQFSDPEAGVTVTVNDIYLGDVPHEAFARVTVEKVPKAPGASIINKPKAKVNWKKRSVKVSWQLDSEVEKYQVKLLQGSKLRKRYTNKPTHKFKKILLQGGQVKVRAVTPTVGPWSKWRKFKP